ncbi:MAG: hypothetical protein HC895_00560 [Leptolyngbyaceae cyanobacterium SM1_3_5]|nr:hypothetical protein [Leptolyngbyaceae cyanobacterium SM1_3_5]
MTNAINPTLVSENFPDRAADSDNGAAIASFNSLYQEFVGVPIEARERRRTIYYSPAFLKIALAGTSALVTALVVARSLTQDAPAPPAYLYREPASLEQNSSSIPAIPTVVAQLALSKPESPTVPLRPVQPTRTFSTTGGESQLPQLAPAESLVSTSLRRSKSTDLALAAPNSSGLSAPTNAAPPLASTPNQSSQPADGLLPELVVPTPPLAQANSAPLGPQPIVPPISVASSIAPPSVIVDRYSAAASVATETAPAQPSPSSSSTESASSTTDQSLHDFLASKQSMSDRILPLSDRAALEAIRVDRIGAFWVVRLPLSVYQNIWFSLQAESKASLLMPTQGFVDRQLQIIVLPTILPSISASVFTENFVNFS